MASAMAQIAARAADGGVRWVVTFVDEANTPSLKGCERAGFAPYLGVSSCIVCSAAWSPSSP